MSLFAAWLRSSVNTCAINWTSVLVWSSDGTYALYTYRLASVGAGSDDPSAQLNFVWRLPWVRACALALHVTTVPFLASRAAMFRQRVATLRRDLDELAPRCVDLRELDSRLLAIHARTS